MAGFEVTRLLQNPLGQIAPAGQCGDIVRVRNGWATIYLDPAEFARSSEGGLLRMLAEADPRPLSVARSSTPAGGRATPIHRARPNLRIKSAPYVDDTIAGVDWVTLV
jgi:hypothetical protein